MNFTVSTMAVLAAVSFLKAESPVVEFERKEGRGSYNGRRKAFRDLSQAHQGNAATLLGECVSPFRS